MTTPQFRYETCAAYDADANKAFRENHSPSTCHECNLREAREIVASARERGTIRQPLYVLNEKAPKGKPIPLNGYAKRVAELRKRYPHLTLAQAQRFELDALLATHARTITEAA